MKFTLWLIAGALVVAFADCGWRGVVKVFTRMNQEANRRANEEE